MGNGALVGLLGGQENVREGDVTNRDEVLRHIRLKEQYMMYIIAILMAWSLGALITSVLFGAVAKGESNATFSPLPRMVFIYWPMGISALMYDAMSYRIAREPHTVISRCMLSFCFNVIATLVMFIFTLSCIFELQEEPAYLANDNHGVWHWAYTIGGGMLTIWFPFMAWRLWVYARDIQTVITCWGPITHGQLHAVEMAGTKHDDEARKKREAESKKEK
jgi:hypothetical protein